MMHSEQEAFGACGTSSRRRRGRRNRNALVEVRLKESKESVQAEGAETVLALPLPQTLLTKNRTLLKRRIILPIFSIKSFNSKAVKIVVINKVL
jgi:hypothetical protein